MFHTNFLSSASWIEISKAALEHNFSTLKAILGTSELGIVLKGNAYGHGLLPVAHVAQQHADVHWLFTANLQEALLLRIEGITKSILVMGFIDTNPLFALEHSIDLSVYDRETAVALNQIACAHDKKFSVHVKVDTGLSRLGIIPSTAVAFLKELQSYPGLVVKAIFTHLADAANANTQTTIAQLDAFDKLLEKLKQENLMPPITHVISSGAIALTTKKNYTIARIGGNCYGLWKAESYKQRFNTAFPNFNLLPALHWKARISHIKKVPANTTIGYGCTYSTQQSSTLAVIPVGYADGYPRVSSHTLSIAVSGFKVPVIGVVSMNMIIADITDIPVPVDNGTEVTLMGGPYGTTIIPVEEVAALCNTIGNEIVTRINNTISRIIL